MNTVREYFYSIVGSEQNLSMLRIVQTNCSVFAQVSHMLPLILI